MRNGPTVATKNDSFPDIVIIEIYYPLSSSIDFKVPLQINVSSTTSASDRMDKVGYMHTVKDYTAEITKICK